MSSAHARRRALGAFSRTSRAFAASSTPRVASPRRADAGMDRSRGFAERRGRVTRVGARARRDERVRSSTNRFSRDRGERKGERERGDAETDAESRDARRLETPARHLEAMEDEYRKDPKNVHESWAALLRQLDAGMSGAQVSEMHDAMASGTAPVAGAAGRADDPRVDSAHHVNSGVSNQRSQHRESRSVGARRASDADLSRSQSVWF